MMLSVVIPTRNRPALLAEALQSFAREAGTDCEAVIVDDASTPPVDSALVRIAFGGSLRVIRNDSPVNVCVARDQGVQASVGDLILHLDDDDRLADGALEACTRPFVDDPELEVMFLNVLGFGPNADGFNQRQRSGVARIVNSVGAKGTRGGVVRFDGRLFPALLAGVPMAFQRSIVRRSAWNRVGAFRRRIYAMTDFDAGTDVLSRVPPLWNESEWAMYASIMCNTALMLAPLYLQRCAGQGYFSIERTKLASFDTRIAMMEHLTRAVRETEDFAPWRTLVREYRGKAHFDRAYACARNGMRTEALRSAVRALGAEPCWRNFLVCVRLAGGSSLTEWRSNTRRRDRGSSLHP